MGRIRRINLSKDEILFFYTEEDVIRYIIQLQKIKSDGRRKSWRCSFIRIKDGKSQGKTFLSKKGALQEVRRLKEFLKIRKEVEGC